MLCCRCLESILYLSYTTACACSALSCPVLHHIIPGVQDAQQQHNIRFSKEFLFFMTDAIRRCRTPCTIHNTRHPRSTYTEGEGGLVEMIWYGITSHHSKSHHLSGAGSPVMPSGGWQFCPASVPVPSLLRWPRIRCRREVARLSVLSSVLTCVPSSLSSKLADTMVGQVSH